MTAGRPPTTVSGQVNAMAKRLAGAQGVMEPAVRLSVMETLLRNAGTDLRYTGAPSREALIRLAAQ
jgi:hypothetical protein